jgi:hypothetical protein
MKNLAIVALIILVTSPANAERKSATPPQQIWLRCKAVNKIYDLDSSFDNHIEKRFERQIDSVFVWEPSTSSLWHYDDKHRLIGPHQAYAGFRVSDDMIVIESYYSPTDTNPPCYEKYKEWIDRTTLAYERHYVDTCGGNYHKESGAGKTTEDAKGLCENIDPLPLDFKPAI